MKRNLVLLLAAVLTLCFVVLTGCQTAAVDPGVPPENVINPIETEPTNDTLEPEHTADVQPNTEQPADETQAEGQPNGSSTAYEGETLENAVSIRIGRDGQTEYSINMYNNAAVATMLDYLTGQPLLFPTYTYSEEEGFVGQSIRGNYTRDEETTIPDIEAGELYLFSGGQLRLYFKDMPGANITATPVGYVAEAGDIPETVQNAYEANLNDTWGVDVYFWITKHIQ